MDDITITRNLDLDAIKEVIAAASGCQPDDVSITIAGNAVSADAKTTVGALREANRKTEKRIKAAEAEANTAAITKALTVDNTDEIIDALAESPAGKAALA